MATEIRRNNTVTYGATVRCSALFERLESPRYVFAATDDGFCFLPTRITAVPQTRSLQNWVIRVSNLIGRLQGRPEGRLLRNMEVRAKAGSDLRLQASSGRKRPPHTSSLTSELDLRTSTFRYVYPADRLRKKRSSARPLHSHPPGTRPCLEHRLRQLRQQRLDRIHVIEHLRTGVALDQLSRRAWPCSSMTRARRACRRKVVSRPGSPGYAPMRTRREVVDPRSACARQASFFTSRHRRSDRAASPSRR